MNTPDTLEQLSRQVRSLRRYCIAVSALLVAGLVGAATQVNRFDELSVERLNIIDADGKPRLILANASRFPPPILNGKTFKRALTPAGILFMNGKGDEVGGLAITDLEKGRVSALAFDYANMDALGLMTRITPDGKDSVAGLIINSRPDESLDPIAAARAVATRIQLQNHNEVAELVLSDSKGRPRLKLFVGTDDQPVIEMLDEKGASVYSVRK